LKTGVALVGLLGVVPAGYLELGLLIQPPTGRPGPVSRSLLLQLDYGGKGNVSH